MVYHSRKVKKFAYMVGIILIPLLLFIPVFLLYTVLILPNDNSLIVKFLLLIAFAYSIGPVFKSLYIYISFLISLNNTVKVTRDGIVVTKGKCQVHYLWSELRKVKVYKRFMILTAQDAGNDFAFVVSKFAENYKELKEKAA